MVYLEPFLYTKPKKPVGFYFLIPFLFTYVGLTVTLYMYLKRTCWWFVIDKLHGKRQMYHMVNKLFSDGIHA